MSPAQRLQDAAQSLVAAAESGRPILPLLKGACPHICQQIRADARHPELFTWWGRCVNRDENVGRTIVHPAILEAIGELAGLPQRGPFPHAGLQHTYGYLFSLLDTPHGAKRDRWVDPDLEKGLGIDVTLLSERPKDGTLLANVTGLLARLVFRGQPRLCQLDASSAAELLRYPYDRLQVQRIVEQVTLPGSEREISLVTDLVALPYAKTASSLLIYSAQSTSRSALRLITAFPVEAEAVQTLVASVPPAGEPVEIRLRYNAYVPGLHGRTLQGRRAFAPPPGQR